MTDLADLITTVRQEIAELRKNIAKQEDQLHELRQQLGLHERISRMLEGDRARARTAPRSTAKRPARATRKSATKKKAPAKKKPAKRTDWNAILEKLPQSFAVAQVKEAAGNASTDADVHQALLRWRQAEKVTTPAKGRYEKTQVRVVGDQTQF